MERPLIVLDTETANARGAPHLLELGALRVVEGEVEDTFERLVLPEVPIDPETHGVHGIGADDLATAAPAAEVLAAFARWIGGHESAWFIAHDARRDARALAFAHARAGLEAPRNPFLDTLALARRHCPEAPDHQLDTLVQILELEGAPPHRALGDAVYCWKVFEELLERRGGAEGLLAELLGGRSGPITIQSEWPSSPRLPRRLRGLDEALRAGTGATLSYGSEEPLARLPVLPRLLYSGRDHAYLEAECGLSGALKTYRLDRIQRVLCERDAPKR